MANYEDEQARRMEVSPTDKMPPLPRIETVPSLLFLYSHGLKLCGSSNVRRKLLVQFPVFPAKNKAFPKFPH